MQQLGIAGWVNQTSGQTPSLQPANMPANRVVSTAPVSSFKLARLAANSQLLLGAVVG